MKLRIKIFLGIIVTLFLTLILSCLNGKDTYDRKLDISLLKAYEIDSAHNIKSKKREASYTGLYYTINKTFEITERVNGKNFEMKQFMFNGTLMYEEESFAKGLSNAYDQKGILVDCMLFKKDGSSSSISLNKADSAWEIKEQIDSEGFTEIVKKIPDTVANSSEIKGIIETFTKERRRQTIIVKRDQIEEDNGKVLYEGKPYTGFVLDFKTKENSVSLQLYDSGHEVKDNTFVIDLQSKP